MKTLNFITGNKNKLSEVRAILGDAISVDNKSIDVPEIQGTIEEIAKEKCRRAADVVCNSSSINSRQCWSEHDGLRKIHCLALRLIEP